MAYIFVNDQVVYSDFIICVNLKNIAVVMIKVNLLNNKTSLSNCVLTIFAYDGHVYEQCITFARDIITIIATVYARDMYYTRF